MQLDHQRLAETHDLTVRLALGIEVGTTLGATHRQTGQAVLEDLLEPQELEHAEIHGRVEAQSALVGADAVVELHTPCAVGTDFTVIILPGHAEDDDPIRLGHTLQDLLLDVVRVIEVVGHQALGNFLHGLNELRLTGVTLYHTFHEAPYCSVNF